ncbi:MAG: diguanylate cyclase [Porticoccaceae bacterium]
MKPKISTSFGIRFIDLNPRTSIDNLISTADPAMYKAKKSGKGQAVFFEE